MLDLKLRGEFLSAQMRGTVIDLNEMVYAKTVQDVLSITYPTADIRNALRAITMEDGRPVVLVGDRGRGKSHILSVVHYSFQDAGAVALWAREWAAQLHDQMLERLNPPTAFHPISVVLLNQEYPTLWSVLFRWHRNGQLYRGKFEQAGTPVPSRSLMEELFTDQPTALILDELQTWFDTLPSQPAGGSSRDLAFNFIQILAELASDRPDLLRLVVSVRDSSTDSYRQIHRNNPVLIDFKGVDSRHDRVRLIQHRLFENYRQIPRHEVESAVSAYADERVRLHFGNVTGPAQEDRRREVADSWPFAPELLGVLEDDFLMAAASQATRDLMRVLVRMYKARGEAVPVLTVADIDISDDRGPSGDLASQVDTTAGAGSNLREVAQRNLQAIKDQGTTLAHAAEVISALWVRSLAPRPQPGATPKDLHLDITRTQAIDDNLFDEELNALVAASFNVWEEGGRLSFRREENPKSRLLASARNDKLFANGQDISYLERAALAALNPMDAATSVVSRLIVLGRDWESDPWSRRTGDDLPTQWREPMVLALPEFVPEERLARWLRDKVSARRNLVRFLMPAPGRPSPYEDKDLVELARCSYLADEWGKSDRKYADLKREYDRPLRDKLSRWFERLALLQKWNFQNPGATKFTIDPLNPGTAGVLKTIEDHIASAVFEPDVFRSFVLDRAKKQVTARALIDELTEPPADPAETAIPYLGETALYERIMMMAARDDIALRRNGSDIRRDKDDIDDRTAFNRIRGKAIVSGRYLAEVELWLPRDVAAGPSTPTAAPPGVEPPGTGVGTTAGVTPFPGGIAPGGTGLAEPPSGYRAVPRKTLRSAEARVGINLLGDLAKWGIQERRILGARVAFEDMSFHDLKELLQRLPPKLRGSLEVDVEDGGQ